MADLLHKHSSLTKKILLIVIFMISSRIMFGHGYSYFADNKLVKTINCYPNPATSFVNFEFDKTIDKTCILQVFSFSGKKMTEVAASSNKITVQLDNFFRGIYVYQLRDKSGRIIESGKFQVVK